MAVSPGEMALETSPPGTAAIPKRWPYAEVLQQAIPAGTSPHPSPRPSMKDRQDAPGAVLHLGTRGKKVHTKRSPENFRASCHILVAREGFDPPTLRV